MNYSDVLNNARQCIGKYCKACPVCNGVALSLIHIWQAETQAPQPLHFSSSM